MKPNYSKSLMSLVLTLALSPLSQGATLETPDYADILRVVKEKHEFAGPRKLLVVYDVDNTLLTSHQNFGTDQWFDWQSQLIKAGDFGEAVARDFEGLLAVQRQIYALDHMRETQEEVSDVVKEIQKLGIASIVLTARSIDTRDSTIRALRENELEFRSSAIGQNGGFTGSFLPEASRWVPSTRPISYQDGVMMVGGQHKGAMLRALLEKTKQHFSTIVFVDDKEKNILHMEQGFADSSVDLTTIRYTKQDQMVEAFKRSSKHEEVTKWRILSNLLRKIF